jgi:hypothetical protein
MASFLVGLVIVFGGWWLVRAFANAQPAKVRGLVRKLGAGLIIAFAGLMAVRGQISLAMPLLLLGLGLLGQQMPLPFTMPWQSKSPGQRSRVATRMLRMELDHDTGLMEGEVLLGTMTGRRLSSLSLTETEILHGECARAGDQSLALLEAWINRCHPEWRSQWSKAASSGQSAASSQRMTRAEALAILGLKDGATPPDIRSAHRRLMKTVHPDLGGSDYLAAKINEAKAFLLQDGPTG